MAMPTVEPSVDDAQHVRRRVLGTALAIFFLTFAVYGGTANRESASLDTHAASAEAWSIAVLGTPWLEDAAQDSFDKNPFLSEAPNGHVVAKRTAGPVLLAIPVYWVAGQLGVDDFELWPGGLAAAGATALTVTCLYLALSSLVRQRAAISAALVVAFATPTWSVSADAPWTHTVTQLGIAGAAVAASRGRWWWVGLMLGVALFGRPHLALIAAAVGIGVAVTRRSPRLLVAVGLPSTAALGVLIIWNRWMFGSWSIGGAYGNRFDAAAKGFDGSAEFDAPHAQLLNYLGFWVSPDRGFLVWTPLLLVLLPSIVKTWRQAPDWSQWLAVGGLLYTFFQLRLNYFAGGDFFYGYRHGLELLTCLVPIGALAWQRSEGITRRVAGAAVALQLAAVGLGAITNGFALPLEKAWTDNSFAMALRENPVPIVVWTALAVGLVVVLARVTRDSTQVLDPPPG